MTRFELASLHARAQNRLSQLVIERMFACTDGRHYAEWAQALEVAQQIACANDEALRVQTDALIAHQF
jgi:hypothetical protein